MSLSSANAQSKTLSGAQESASRWILVPENALGPENPKEVKSTDSKSSSFPNVKGSEDKKSVALAAAGMARVALRRSGGGKLAQIRTRIVVKHSYASGAGAALNTVFPLVPMATAEQSALASIFDEVKVHGIRHHWTITANTATALNATADGAVAYDPVDSSAYTSVPAVLEASQHCGPVQVESDLASATLPSEARVPHPYTKTGMWTWNIKVPPPSAVNPLASIEIIGGQWFSTKETSAIVGYLKPYFDNPSTGGTTTFTGYVEFDVSFRSRT